MTSRVFALSLASLVAGACAGPDLVAPPTATTLRDRLATEPVHFALDATPGGINLGVAIRHGATWDSHRVALDVTGGDVALSTTPTDLWLEGLELDLADLTIAPADLPPNGLQLVNLVVHTEARHPCDVLEWADQDQRCDASVAPALVLDWAMRAGDEVVPLGRQHLATLALGATLLDPTPGQPAELAIGTMASGPLWDWAGLVRFEDPVLMLQGTEAQPDPEP